MHFLCLHGAGTNSHVLETQTASLRHELDGHHTFDFVEGSISCPVAPGKIPFLALWVLDQLILRAEIKPFFASADKYYRYYDGNADSILRALSQLSHFISEEGPFDGVIGFSQGATLLATYLVLVNKQQPEAPVPFRCAIFLSATRPFDTQALTTGQLKYVEQTAEAEPLIRLPTTHIWGVKDIENRDDSEQLSMLCDEAQREEVKHDGGHEIPGARAQSDLQNCVKAIRRTIELASIKC
ncbi:serine hydrolase FSH protein [Rutstroemia sp. NJR-2017a BBW]|nr:serine hydrolase FSH protein [Rutstroemia sp. NJR-2017a BBW]